MIPVVALIGRSNVGKSTLFNQLTRTRDALVTDFPGLTRDRKYGRAKWKGHEFIVIDTAGIDGSKEGGVETRMVGQSLVAIEEADIVLFMVDGSAGLMAADHGIAKHLRILKKFTVIVANKTDGIDIDSAIGEFYSLGLGEIIPIAASHLRGINSLLKKILLPLALEGGSGTLYGFKPCLDDTSSALTKDPQKVFFDPQSLPIKLAIVGRPNVGKSTLINCILGKDRVVVYDIPGTTRDSIYIPMMRCDREYVLLDTAGVRKRCKVMEAVEKFSVIKTFQAIEDANVVLLMIDAKEGISDQDLSLLGFILNSGRALLIVVNKWDGVSSEMRDKVKEILDHRLGFINFARVHFISALHGRGVANMFESVNEAYQCSTNRISTALLTRIMHMAVDEHKPPLVRGRRVKPKYAHAGGYNPPIVVIHGTQVKDLPEAYKRYLMNYFRRSLEIMGTPIRIQFNETANLFAGQRKILTPLQLRKRKRLMDHFKKNNK
ncbi:MAG: 50S ribosomal subunit stability factor [Sodalis sp. Fse]|nr:MAG: 50S ribosomal subunit stability factor [Sodalis sp. Fse]UVK79022.1 MAG: 50S ribosomal subunit stability factor [Sodalis sp. Ffu]